MTNTTVMSGRRVGRVDQLSRFRGVHRGGPPATQLFQAGCDLCGDLGGREVVVESGVGDDGGGRRATNCADAGRTGGGAAEVLLLGAERSGCISWPARLPENSWRELRLVAVLRARETVWGAVLSPSVPEI